jgi:hypothetical protein
MPWYVRSFGAHRDVCEWSTIPVLSEEWQLVVSRRLLLLRAEKTSLTGLNRWRRTEFDVDLMKRAVERQLAIVAGMP